MEREIKKPLKSSSLKSGKRTFFFDFGKNIGDPIEAWGPLFWEGPWTKLEEGKVVDSVDYPHSLTTFMGRETR